MKGHPTRRGSLHDIGHSRKPRMRRSPRGCASTAPCFVGKTTAPEFGWKGVTDSPLTGITRNPWDLGKTSGGSSGGAASSVAVGMGTLAIGSDGGGSIRIPSSLTGVFGHQAHGRPRSLLSAGGASGPARSLGR